MPNYLDVLAGSTINILNKTGVGSVDPLPRCHEDIRQKVHNPTARNFSPFSDLHCN